MCNTVKTIEKTLHSQGTSASSSDPKRDLNCKLTKFNNDENQFYETNGPVKRINELKTFNETLRKSTTSFAKPSRPRRFHRIQPGLDRIPFCRFCSFFVTTISPFQRILVAATLEAQVSGTGQGKGTVEYALSRPYPSRLTAT